MLVGSESANDRYLWATSFSSGEKTRIWGFRPPVPPLRRRDAAPQTPLRKVRSVSSGVGVMIAIAQWIDLGVGTPRPPGGK
jgi:hypothetical protein